MSLRKREHSFFNLLLEALLVTVGVFLALWANNWHEEREHRALTASALRNFAEEIRINQQAVQKERTYHETLAQELNDFLVSNEAPTQERFDRSVHLMGLHPITFEHTAWDLALATGALSYLKPQLALDISRVYTNQTAFQTLENSFLASAFTPATFAGDNLKGLAISMRIYLGDVNIQEPLILQRYETVIPELDRALPQPAVR